MSGQDYPDPFEGLTGPQKTKRLLADAVESFAPIHRLMDEERAFCWDLEQYQNDRGNTLDRERVQPRDQSPFRLARFKAASILRTPPYFKARPIDKIADPKKAAWAKWAIEFELTNPQNRLDRVIRDTVWSGLTSRMGVAAADWEPDAGLFGDIRYRFVDPKNVYWAPGFNDPHDPECPWFMEVSHMRIDTVQRKRGWKNTAGLAPDTGIDSVRGATMSNIQNPSGVVDFSKPSRDQIETMKTQPRITIVKLWERFSGEKRKRPTRVRALSEQERYMVIAHGENAEQRVEMDYGGKPMPEFDVIHEGPMAGTTLKRIDAMMTEEERLAYPNGKLTISAPFSHEGAELFAGNWPQRMRTFPYLVWQPYANPFKAIGPSDVDLNWTMTLVKNGTIRRWYEQLHESRGIVMLPEDGLFDAYGEPFMYTDANGIAAFYGKGFPPQGVQIIRGPEPSTQLERFYQVVDANLRGNEGTGDVSSLGNAEQLKGVAVGAIERSVQTGNIAVDDHVATWQIEFGLWLSVIHDIQRARWSEERWVRYLGADGGDAYQAMRGDDIPAADIIITARPTLDAFNAEKLGGLMQFAQIAQTNPAVAKIAARYMDLDPSDLEDMLSATTPQGLPPTGAQAGMPPGPQGAPSPNAPPAGAAGMPPGAGPMNGGAPNGVPPQFAAMGPR